MNEISLLDYIFQICAHNLLFAVIAPTLVKCSILRVFVLTVWYNTFTPRSNKFMVTPATESGGHTRGKGLLAWCNNSIMHNQG